MSGAGELRNRIARRTAAACCAAACCAATACCCCIAAIDWGAAAGVGAAGAGLTKGLSAAIGSAAGGAAAPEFRRCISACKNGLLPRLDMLLRIQAPLAVDRGCSAFPALAVGSAGDCPMWGRAGQRGWRC